MVRMVRMVRVVRKVPGVRLEPEPLEPRTPRTARTSGTFRTADRRLRDLKHRVDHLCRELARVRVLAAGVITADERLAIRQAVSRRMGERRPRPEDDAPAFQQLQIRV